MQKDKGKRMAEKIVLFRVSRHKYSKDVETITAAVVVNVSCIDDGIINKGVRTAKRIFLDLFFSERISKKTGIIINE